MGRWVGVSEVITALWLFLNIATIILEQQESMDYSMYITQVKSEYSRPIKEWLSLPHDEIILITAVIQLSF